MSILILSIIILLIIIVFYLLSSKNKKLYNYNDDEYNYDEYNDINYYRGDLYQLCPCNSGYICDNGVCKKPIGKRCIITSECINDSICHNGYCTEKPGEWKHPIDRTCKKGMIISNNHLTLLNEDIFILLSGLKTISGVISICDSFNDNEILIITLEKLYIINLIDNKIYDIYENSRPFRSKTKDIIFNENNNIYYLRGTRIYKLNINGDEAHWNNINNIKNIKLNDGSKLVIKNNKYYIDNELNRGIIRNFLTKRSLDDIDTGINIGTNISQIIKIKNHNIFYCLNNDKTIDRYDCDKNIIDRLVGYGNKLILANDRIWLLSNDICLSISD